MADARVSDAESCTVARQSGDTHTHTRQQHCEPTMTPPAGNADGVARAPTCTGTLPADAPNNNNNVNVRRQTADTRTRKRHRDSVGRVAQHCVGGLEHDDESKERLRGARQRAPRRRPCAPRPGRTTSAPRARRRFAARPCSCARRCRRRRRRRRRRARRWRPARRRPANRRRRRCNGTLRARTAQRAAPSGAAHRCDSSRTAKKKNQKRRECVSARLYQNQCARSSSLIKRRSPAVGQLRARLKRCAVGARSARDRRAHRRRRQSPSRRKQQAAAGVGRRAPPRDRKGLQNRHRPL